MIAGLIPKRQFLLKQPNVAKVLNLDVDRKGYWALAPKWLAARLRFTTLIILPKTEQILDVVCNERQRQCANDNARAEIFFSLGCCSLGCCNWG